MKLFSRFLFCLLIVGLLGLAYPLFAMDTGTVPQGVFIIQFKVGYQTSLERFQDDFGFGTEDLAEDYRVEILGKDLSNDPLLKDVSFGKVDADFSSYGIGLEFDFGYGVTDDFAILLQIPTRYISQSINPYIVPPSPESGYNGVYLYRQGGDPNGVPAAIVPDIPEALLGAGLLLPGFNTNQGYINTQDLIDILEMHPKDVPWNAFMAEFGDGYFLREFAMNYKKIGNFEHYGVNDIRLAFRYRFWGDDESLIAQAFTVWMVFPAGRPDDPDNLLDSAQGDGQFDLGFLYGIDIRPFSGFMINFSTGYTDAFLHERKDRVPMGITRDENGQIISRIPMGSNYKNGVRVTRDIGGNIDAFLTLAYDITDFLNVGVEFYFYYKFQDDFYIEDYPKYIKDLQNIINVAEAAGAATVDHDYDSFPENQWGEPNNTPVAERTPEIPIAEAKDLLWREQDALMNRFDGLEWETVLSSCDMNFGVSFSTVKWFVDGSFPFPFIISTGFVYSIFGQNVEVNIGGYLSLTLIGSVELFGVEFDNEDAEEVSTLRF